MKNIKKMGVEKREKMDLGFALFNCHINNAKSKAKKDFIKKFGLEVWNKEIEPFWGKGIMSIFSEPPNEPRAWYVEKIQEYVNKGR